MFWFSAIYWRCWRPSCTCTLQTNVFNVHDDSATIMVRKVSGDHNHSDDFHMIQTEKFRCYIKDDLEEDSSRPIKRSYDSVVSTVSRRGEMSRHDIPEFHNTRSSLQRKNNNTCHQFHEPLMMSTLQEVGAKLGEVKDFCFVRTGVGVYSCLQRMKICRFCKTLNTSMWMEPSGPHHVHFTNLLPFRSYWWQSNTLSFLLAYRKDNWSLQAGLSST